MTSDDMAAGIAAHMAADDNDPFEQGKLARFNHEPRQNPYPKDSEQFQRWDAGYKFIEQGLVSV